ncbi:RNA polymerase sigma-70 factor [Flagellimonas alvinocaridis]|uniref:RNA polymerase sigma-70 factor n=1 Tax=Flagellimonas alvinocaridis TaxID=2530200 RepID=A0A4S8RNF3_9FLAO|nr:RNA polymerase sigma-70 factor [Allomuricauda alvinocaridis]THV59211.1 RNA polymerase sigma-70 factor [Allomuricauda alvinocaridis]
MGPLFLHTDKALLHRLQNNDESALTELYEKYWNPVYLYTYNVLRDKEICKDIVQDLFMDIWNRREKLNITSTFKAYLFSSARYQIFAQIRQKEKNLGNHLFENLDQRLHHSSPESEYLYQELVQRIGATVERLPKKCREVYTLSREEQLSHAEISQFLDISTKTVENHISKALKALRSSVGSYLFFIWFLFF